MTMFCSLDIEAGAPVAGPLGARSRVGRTPWAYSGGAVGRDERLDFIRGFAAIGFITAHFEAFSCFHFIFWERLGIFSSAELFVMVSGLLLGIVNRDVINRTGSIGPSAQRLCRRAFELYRAYVVLIALVGLVAAARVIRTTAITTFTDRWAETTYGLYPPDSAPLGHELMGVLLLRSTPHQVQILGLYSLLMLAAPCGLWLLRRGLWAVLLAASFGLWFANQFWRIRLTGAQFEFAFPSLSWQIYFFGGLVVGYHARYEIAAWVARDHRRIWIVAAPAVLVALSAFVLAQCTDNPSFPAGSRLDLVSPGTFRSWYDAAFEKNSVGAGRIVSATGFLISFYLLLSQVWRPARRLFGWLFLPLGRNSLYVFLTHLAFVAAADQIPGIFNGIPRFSWSTIWFNTALLASLIFGVWLLVRHRVLYRWIPR